MPKPIRTASACVGATSASSGSRVAARCAWTARLTNASAAASSVAIASGSPRSSRQPASAAGCVAERVGRGSRSASSAARSARSALGIGVLRLRARRAAGAAGAGAPATRDDEHPLGLAAEVAARPRADGPGELELDEGEERSWPLTAGDRYSTAVSARRELLAEVRARGAAALARLVLARSSCPSWSGSRSADGEVGTVGLSISPMPVDQALPLARLEDLGELARDAARAGPVGGG